MIRRLLAGVSITLILGVTAGCTPQQIADWVAWHQEDPAAAEAFANLPEIQNLLHNDWDQDGVVEPDQPAPSAPAPARSSGGGTVWDRLAQCESGGNWSYNGGSGYDGGLQFLPSTWRAYGGSGYAWQHSRAEQIRIAERVLDDVGWGAWPACSRKLGLR